MLSYIVTTIVKRRKEYSGPTGLSHPSEKSAWQRQIPHRLLGENTREMGCRRKYNGFRITRF